MSLAIGIIAAAFLAGEPAKPADPASISYTFRVVDAPALDWRKAHHFDLKPLGRQGASQVWLMPKPAAEALLKQAGIEAVASPKLIAAHDSTATIETHTTRDYATSVSNHAVGPFPSDTGSAHLPQPEAIREEYTATVSGRATEAGIDMKIALDCTWVADVRKIGIPGHFVTQYHKCNCVPTIEVPQIVSSQVSLDWTVPDGAVMVISHGIQTVSGKKYPKGASIERLTIVEAQKVAVPTAEVVPASFHAGVSPDAYKGMTRELVTVRTMPPVPSRTLLPAVGPNGEVVELPPLPDDRVAPASFATTSVPRPSPQALTTTTNPKLSLKFDPNVATAMYPPAPIGRSSLHPSMREPMNFDPDITAVRYEPLPIAPSNIRLDGAELAKGKTQTLRIPISGKLSIEVKARVIPAEQPE
jgi:hypothetical protein